MKHLTYVSFIFLLNSSFYMMALFEKKPLMYDGFGNYHISNDDPMGLEWEACKLLKENPIPENLYISVPWYALSRRNELRHICRLQLKKSFAYGSFTICDCLEGIMGQRTLWAAKLMGINCIFTPSATKSQRYINGIRIEPFPYIPLSGIAPAAHKDILYSFIGTETHPIRKKIFTMKHPEGTYIKQRNNFHYFLDAKQQEENKREYQDILARSRFSLCPRGFEAGSIRFYESLQAEAIPILIADDLRLPENFNWNSCMIQVAEGNIESVPEIIAHITPEQEAEMRKACIKAHKQFSGKNLVSTVRDYFSKYSPNTLFNKLWTSFGFRSKK